MVASSARRDNEPPNEREQIAHGRANEEGHGLSRHDAEKRENGDGADDACQEDEGPRGSPPLLSLRMLNVAPPALVEYAPEILPKAVSPENSPLRVSPTNLNPLSAARRLTCSSLASLSPLKGSVNESAMSSRRLPVRKAFAVKRDEYTRWLRSNWPRSWALSHFSVSSLALLGLCHFSTFSRVLLMRLRSSMGRISLVRVSAVLEGRISLVCVSDALGWRQLHLSRHNLRGRFPYTSRRIHGHLLSMGHGKPGV